MNSINDLEFKDFDFPAVDENFAAPMRPAEDINLVVVNKHNETISHDKFVNLGDYFEDSDLLVFNDVGISPSRLIARTESGTEFDLCFLLQDGEEHVWDVVVLGVDKAPKKEKFISACGLITGELMGKTRDFDGGYWVARHVYDGYRGRAHIDQTPTELRSVLDKNGKMMHPWYANINDLPNDGLNPVTTRKTGGVLLSEPSRRINQAMHENFRSRGIESCYISLWMSFSWNQAEATDKLKSYGMNEEEYEVTRESLEQVKTALRQNRRVISIGTSGVRTLESVPLDQDSASGRTELFISPGFEFKYSHSLLTNLHNPQGTHVIMAAAFGGSELVVEACRQSVERGHYFGIHGDSMLVIGDHKPAYPG